MSYIFVRFFFFFDDFISKLKIICNMLCYAWSLRRVRLFATPWTGGHQAPLTMGILQERILEWVTMPSSRASSQPRDWTQVSHIAGGFFTSWATREALFVAYSVQFSSVAQSCPTLCDLMNRSTPGLPVHHQLPEFTQTHVHRIGDTIQPSHPLSSPSPPAPNPSQHECFPMSQLFTWDGQSTGVWALASFLPKNTQDWSPLEWTGWISLQSKELSGVFSNTTVQKHQFFGAQLSSQSNKLIILIYNF